MNFDSLILSILSHANAFAFHVWPLSSSPGTLKVYQQPEGCKSHKDRMSKTFKDIMKARSRPGANENLSVLARWPTSTWDRSKWSKLSTAMYRHKSWVANTTGYYRAKNCAPLGRPIDTYVQSIPLHQTQQYQQWHAKTYVYVYIYICYI